MDGQGCTFLALDLVPKHLIFAYKNSAQKFTSQDFALAILARKTGENRYSCIS